MNTEQKNKLNKALVKAREQALHDKIKSLSGIPGVTVNYSFNEQFMRSPYTLYEIKAALLTLGVNPYNYQGAKWWQFWLNEYDDLTIRIKKACNYIK